MLMAPIPAWESDSSESDYPESLLTKGSTVPEVGLCSQNA